MPSHPTRPGTRLSRSAHSCRLWRLGSCLVRMARTRTRCSSASRRRRSCQGESNLERTSADRMSPSGNRRRAGRGLCSTRHRPCWCMACRSPHCSPHTQHGTSQCYMRRDLRMHWLYSCQTAHHARQSNGWPEVSTACSCQQSSPSSPRDTVRPHNLAARRMTCTLSDLEPPGIRAPERVMMSEMRVTDGIADSHDS